MVDRLSLRVNRLDARAQAPQPIQPTLHTAITSLPLSLLEQVTANICSDLNAVMVMMFRGQAVAQAPQPTHFS